MEEAVLSIFKSDTLIGIDVYDRIEHPSLVWKEYKKNWLFGDQLEGFQELYCSHTYSIEDIKSGKYLGIPLLVVDAYKEAEEKKEIIVGDQRYKVYYHSRVTFTFTENRKFHKYFDTLEESKKYVDIMRKKGYIKYGNGLSLRK